MRVLRTVQTRVKVEILFSTHDFYRLYIHVLTLFEIVFSFYVKDTNIFPCLHTIRLSYNI